MLNKPIILTVTCYENLLVMKGLSIYIAIIILLKPHASHGKSHPEVLFE